MDLKEVDLSKTFRLTKKLGSGAFGEIFKGKETYS